MKTQFQLWMKIQNVLLWNLVSFHDRLEDAKKAAEAYSDTDIKIVEVMVVVNRERK